MEYRIISTLLSAPLLVSRDGILFHLGRDWQATQPLWRPHPHAPGGLLDKQHPAGAHWPPQRGSGRAQSPRHGCVRPRLLSVPALENLQAALGNGWATSEQQSSEPRWVLHSALVLPSQMDFWDTWENVQEVSTYWGMRSRENGLVNFLMCSLVA